MDWPSDTFATFAPEWGWIIVVYFFLGGIAGGCGFLAALLDLFGTAEDKRVARIGYLIAAPLMVVSGILLVVDLNRPERFWHMLIQSETGFPMLKWWSPISFGVWIVGAFSVAAGLSFLGVLAERIAALRFARFLREGAIGKLLAVATGGFGIWVCGYTGVLLAVTNRPLWGDTTTIGILFLLSGVSAAAALLTLLAWRSGHPGTLSWLGRMDFYSSLMELVVLVVLLLSVWSVAEEVWTNEWGVVLIVGFVIAGVLIPLALHWRPRLLGSLAVPSAAVLVILGSFALRTAVVMASEHV